MGISLLPFFKSFGMKTKREIIYSIIEFVSGFHVTDDSPYDEQLIGDKIDDVRATLIKQQHRENKNVDDEYYQMCDVVIEKETIAELQDDISIKRFYVNLPSLITNVGWDNIKYLGKKTMDGKYNRRSMDGMVAATGRYWTRNTVDYSVVSGSRAIIRNEKTANDIIILGLFKSPSTVTGYTLDDPYPVPDSYKLEMIVKQDIAAALGIMPDEINDSRHNAEQNRMK
jgi:hypothetical protein